MQNMNKFTPSDIKEQKFCIPLYQRLFAWTPKEVEKLLFDLKEHFDSERFKNDNTPYYLGMLTTIERNGCTDLIDGQQRFTVMLLLAVVFKMFDDGWKQFLNNGERLRLVARSEDEEYLKKIAEDNDYTQNVLEGKSSYKYENINMKNALLCICKFIDSYFNDENSKKEYACNIYHHLTFFISELPPHYLSEATSLNKYFEVLNSTGRGLEQHEKLKVDLLKNQKDTDKLVKIWNAVSQMELPIIRRTEEINDADYSELYKRALNDCRNEHYDNVIQIIQESINDELKDADTIDVIPVEKLKHTKTGIETESQDSIITFPEFLLLVLDIFKGCEGKDSFYQSDKLLERFDNNKIEDDKIQDFYHKLLYYRLLIDYYVVRKDISNGQSRFVLIFHGVDKQESREKLKKYQSMLTVSTDFYIWLKPYIENLLSLSDDDLQSAEVLLKNLKQDDNTRRKENGYLELKGFEYPNIKRYWFWRLDYYLWEKFLFDKTLIIETDNNNIELEPNKDVLKNFRFRANRSVEHLHPQDQSNVDNWADDDINGFGNLAMISQGLNSYQSNKSVEEKMGKIVTSINQNKSVESLKLYFMYLQYDKQGNVWTPEMAKNHGKAMLEILNESFKETPSDKEE